MTKDQRLQFYYKMLRDYLHDRSLEIRGDLDEDFVITNQGFCMYMECKLKLVIWNSPTYKDHPNHISQLFPEMWALALEKGLTEKMFWFPSGDRLVRILFLEELVNIMLKETDQNNEETEPTPFKPF